MRFYSKLGEVLDGAERNNRINFFDNSLEGNALRFRDKRRDWDNLIVSEKLQSVQLIEIQGISFGDSVIDEIRIGGETIESDFQLGSEIDNIGAIRLRQGHYAQPADLVVDSIVIERPD